MPTPINKYEGHIAPKAGFHDKNRDSIIITYNLVEICSPFMPYGSSWTIGIRVGSRSVSLMPAVILDCAINRLVLARGNILNYAINGLVLARYLTLH